MLKIELNGKSKEETYQSLLPICEHLFECETHWLPVFCNFVALIKETFNSFSWVGFYLVKDNKLILGPYQGKVACSEIEIGKGVCGTSALKKETIIVDDVNMFEGHIACDENSKSEIVVPLLNDRNILGVLDVDSYNYSNFDTIDKIYLEKLCYILTNKILKLNYKGI